MLPITSNKQSRSYSRNTNRNFHSENKLYISSIYAMEKHKGCNNFQCLFTYFLVLERQSSRERERKKWRYLPYTMLLSFMPATATTGSGWRQEPRTPSVFPIGMSVGPTLESSSTASQNALTGSWVRKRASGTHSVWHSNTRGRCSKQWFNLLYFSECPWGHLIPCCKLGIDYFYNMMNKACLMPIASVIVTVKHMTH